MPQTKPWMSSINSKYKFNPSESIISMGLFDITVQNNPYLYVNILIQAWTFRTESQIHVFGFRLRSSTPPVKKYFREIDQNTFKSGVIGYKKSSTGLRFTNYTPLITYTERLIWSLKPVNTGIVEQDMNPSCTNTIWTGNTDPFAPWRGIPNLKTKKKLQIWATRQYPQLTLHISIAILIITLIVPLTIFSCDSVTSPKMDATGNLARSSHPRRRYPL